ncbi:MAG: Ig-like domain-containing protein [Bacteroidota bacterium]
MRLVFACIFVFLAGCIGTDFVDDPIVGEQITVSHTQVALMVGETLQLTATYSDPYGIPREVALIWTSAAPQVALVDPTGKISALLPGQSVVQPSFGTFLGPLIQVVVVSDPDQVATVTIAAPTTSLNPGEKTQLTVTVTNIEGQLLEGKMVEWFSENDNLLTLTQTGEVTALAAGVAGVHAKVEGVKSNSLTFTIGLARSGMFQEAGGYDAEGMATLRISNGELILELSADFKTSFALGTFIYLANSTNGGAVRSGGFEVAQISTNGAKTFNISQINPSVGLFDYRYVIILCKPASVTFGFADLE